MMRKLWYALIAIGFALLIALLLFILVSSAHGQEYRYLKIEAAYVYEYSVDLPYTEIRNMQWDSQRGFSELANTNPLRDYYLIDFDSRLHGIAYETEIGCFILWMRQDYGTDNQPHVAKAEWITCDNTTT